MALYEGQNPSSPWKNAVLKFVTRSKAYDYAVHNASGLMLGGRITFVIPATADEATQRAVEESAKQAVDMNMDFDPFNLMVAVKPT